MKKVLSFAMRFATITAVVTVVGLITTWIEF